MALGLLGLGGAAALAVRMAGGGGSPGALSVRRTVARDAMARVIPSEYGSQAFTELAPGYSPEILKKYPTFTTCGYAPAYLFGAVAKSEGADAGKLGQAGLTLLKTEAQRGGYWRESGLPRPYDVYALANETGLIVHVGVVEEADGGEWTTLDAGRGPREKQRAEIVVRAFDAGNRTLTNEFGTRRLAGFVDLDAVVFDDGVTLGRAAEGDPMAVHVGPAVNPEAP
jgi:hypothetical protein